jgi:hypothetical protein
MKNARTTLSTYTFTKNTTISLPKTLPSTNTCFTLPDNKPFKSELKQYIIENTTHVTETLLISIFPYGGAKAPQTINAHIGILSPSSTIFNRTQTIQTIFEAVKDTNKPSMIEFISGVTFSNDMPFTHIFKHSKATQIPVILSFPPTKLDEIRSKIHNKAPRIITDPFTTHIKNKSFLEETTHHFLALDVLDSSGT